MVTVSATKRPQGEREEGRPQLIPPDETQGPSAAGRGVAGRRHQTWASRFENGQRGEADQQRFAVGPGAGWEVPGEHLLRCHPRPFLHLQRGQGIPRHGLGVGIKHESVGFARDGRCAHPQSPPTSRRQHGRVLQDAELKRLSAQTIAVRTIW